MKFTLNLTVALGLSFYCNVCSCVATARAADSFDQRRQMFLDAAPSEQLGAFRDKVLSNSRIAIQQGDKPTGCHTDRAGNKLECTYDGADKINDRPVDYAHWPSLENPWMSQPQPGGLLTVINGHQTRRYDFEKWAVTNTQ